MTATRWSGVKKEDVLEAVSDRDVEFLTDLIRMDNLEADIREHLADVIHDLLTGKRKFPRRRPKKVHFADGHAPSEIAFRV
jgi:hypothetical protein